LNCARLRKAHILEGLIIASDNIDVIALIRGSKNTEEAREKINRKIQTFRYQARAIVEMRLRQLTGLEQDKLRAEYDELMKLIEHLKALS
jgi:DNA gyrase subunit A